MLVLLKGVFVKTVVKIIILFLISVISVYIMYKNNIINFNIFVHTFEEYKKLILIISCIQILNCLFLALRYFSILKIFKIKSDFRNVLAATFVSNGIGQWLPGSMAISEVIRVGLMLGVNYNFTISQKNNKSELDENLKINQNLSELSNRSKLAAASIIDRIIGFFVMLIFSIVMISYIYFDLKDNYSMQKYIILLLTISISFLFFILFLPIFSRTLFFRKLFTRIEVFVLLLFRFGIINIMFRKLFHELNSIFDAIALGSKKIRLFLTPICYSVVVVFLGGLGLYLSGFAVAGNISFAAILATMSILSIASLLPLGLAGMGGMQIIAAILFSIFQTSPQAAVSAQLLQTTINLFTITFVGLLFARLSAKQIRAVLLSKKNDKLLLNNKMSSN